MKIPKPESPGEAAFAFHLKCRKIDAVREYEFWVGRKWRFDFCIPDAKIAIEIEGGIYNGGRHVRPGGFTSDCEKYNHAALAGFRVFRFTTEQVASGAAIDQVRRVLGCPSV